MKKTNSMKLQFVSRSANEGFARTAVSEAVTNCIVHAYADQLGTVYISADLYEGGKVVIRIRDKGCGIPDVDQAMEPLFTTGGEERAGLGFAVMQSLMDKVRVRSQVGKGTTVTLERRIESRGDRNDRAE